MFNPEVRANLISNNDFKDFCWGDEAYKSPLLYKVKNLLGRLTCLYLPGSRCCSRMGSRSGSRASNWPPSTSTNSPHSWPARIRSFTCTYTHRGWITHRWNTHVTIFASCLYFRYICKSSIKMCLSYNHVHVASDTQKIQPSDWLKWCSVFMTLTFIRLSITVILNCPTNRLSIC